MTSFETNVIRGCAVFDLVVTGLLALPPTASVFIDVLYFLNGWLGGEAVAPPFVAVQWMFVHLAGALGVLWAVARIVEPTRFLGLADAAGRNSAGPESQALSSYPSPRQAVPGSEPSSR